MPKRRSSDLRRAGDDTVVTVVEISESYLRVAKLRKQTDGKADQVDTVTVRWRNDAAQLTSEQGLLEISATLCELVEQHNLQSSQFHFVLGGELCVTKVISGTTEAVRTELREIEDRSSLYLSLGPGEKVMVASSQAIDARHQYALASVCNRRTLSTVYEAALKAGVRVESIEPALISVSRAISQIHASPTEPCLIMYVDENSVEVGVCHEGRLLLDYRPGGQTDHSDIGRVVHQHLIRLQRHSSRQLKRENLELKQVYLCGGGEAISRVMSSFAEFPEFDVCEIVPSSIHATWNVSADTTDSAMVPVLGKLLSAEQTNAEQDAPNFMQHVIASTREPIRPIIIRSLIPLAAVLLFGVAGLLMNMRVQSEADSLQQQVDALLPVQARSLELRLRLRSSEELYDELTQLVESMLPSTTYDIVARVGHCMPSDVWLNDLLITEMKHIKLSGSSFLEAGVFDFVRWLEQAPGFEDVALRSTQSSKSKSGPAIDFSVELNLVDKDGPVKEVARNE